MAFEAFDKLSSVYNFSFLICNIMYFNVNFVQNKNGQMFGRKPGALYSNVWFKNLDKQQ